MNAAAPIQTQTEPFYFRGLELLSTSRAPLSCRGKIRFVCSKSPRKASQQKHRTDYPLLERKWNSSDGALKRAQGWCCAVCVSVCVCFLKRCHPGCYISSKIVEFPVVHEGLISSDSNRRYAQFPAAVIASVMVFYEFEVSTCLFQHSYLNVPPQPFKLDKVWAGLWLDCSTTTAGSRCKCIENTWMTQTQKYKHTHTQKITQTKKCCNHRSKDAWNIKNNRKYKNLLQVLQATRGSGPTNHMGAGSKDLMSQSNRKSRGKLEK